MQWYPLFIKFVVNAVLEATDLLSRLLPVLQDGLLAYVTVLPTNSGAG